MHRLSLCASLFALLAYCACGGAEPKANKPTSADGDGIELGDRDQYGQGDDDDDDDDDDDGMAVSGLKGRLDPYDIDRGVKPHINALTQCFEKEVRRQRYLGGKVELFFVVARDGTVKTVVPTKSDLGAWSVERCLLDIGGAMTFVKPKGGAPAEFRLPLEFPARRSTRWWGEEQAGKEVDDKKINELYGCAEEAKADNPGDEVWLTLYVGARGKVISAGFASSAPVGSEWAECAATKATAWQLSDPRGTIAKLSVRIPPK